MLDRIKSHSCVTLLWHTLGRHSCGTFMGTLVRHSCLTLLLDTLVAYSGFHTLVRNSCKTLLLDTLEHLAVLLCTTKRPHSTSQYYFILQVLHRVIPSTTLYYRACTRHSPVPLRIADSTLHIYLSTLHTQHSTLHTPHFTL